MQKQRIKTHGRLLEESLRHASHRDGELANRPAQVFDLDDMEQVDAGCKYFLLPESQWQIKLRK